MPHLLTAFGENKFLCLFRNRLPRCSVLLDRKKHCSFVEGQNTELHKSRFPGEILVSCAEPMAIPGIGDFHLPGLLL